jgi:hypothetical protein
MKLRSGLGMMSRLAFSGMVMAGAVAMGADVPVQNFREVLQVPEGAPEPDAAGDILLRKFDSRGECIDRAKVIFSLRRLEGNAYYALLVDDPSTDGDSTPQIFSRGKTGRDGSLTLRIDTRTCKRRVLSRGLPFTDDVDDLSGRNFEVQTFIADENGEQIDQNEDGNRLPRRRRRVGASTRRRVLASTPPYRLRAPSPRSTRRCGASSPRPRRDWGFPRAGWRSRGREAPPRAGRGAARRPGRP